MKKIIFFLILVLFACQKETPAPEQKLLKIEVWATSLSNITSTIKIDLKASDWKIAEEKTITFTGNQIVFKTEFYVKNMDVFYLNVDAPNVTISIYAYTRDGHKSFKIANDVKITIIDNDFKDVIIE
jgi:hypothetical protein